MSVRKCSSCGQTTKGEVPFCSNCGALFPVGNEAELMRQAVGYSFDLKWVLLGAVVASLLQFGLLGALWSVWGDKILVGEEGRSLLEVNLNSISPGWGPNTGGTRVTLRIKPDNEGINTATKVMGVQFGAVKAEPFHIKHLRVVKRECNKHCANQVKAQKAYRKCMKGCDEKELKEEEERLGKLIKPCYELADEKEKGEVDDAKYNKRFKKLDCAEHSRAIKAFNKRKTRCEEICPQKKKSMEAEANRCKVCKKQMPMYEKRAAWCKKDVKLCWAYKEDRGRSELPKAPDYSKIDDAKKRQQAKENYEQRRKEAIAANKRREEQEKKQLRTVINVYTPKAPGMTGLVNVAVVFESGEKLVKHDGFYYAKPSREQRPTIQKPKRKLHDPVRTTGFWMLLVLSCLFYLVGGFVVGRLSPGIGTKEPLMAALVGWVLFEVALVLIGAAGTAQLFTIFIGLPAFIGCAIIGAVWAERSLGYG